MIVHGVLSLDVGGLERIVAALAIGQSPATVICVQSRGALANELEAAGVRVICLNEPPRNIAEVLRTLSPCVLHTHQIGAAYHLAPAAKRLGLRVVHTEHGDPFARSASWREWLKLRLLMHRAAKSIDAFACVSNEIAHSVTRCWTVPARKTVVVPNGIALTMPTQSREAVRASLGIPQKAFVVGTVGRLSEVKRQDVLLDAVAMVPNAWVLLVGDGPERARLEALARERGMTPRTVFAGYQPQPANLLNAMDAFALTSRSEGFPVSLLEAWAARLPVVVSAVGGLPAIVAHGTDGFLIAFASIAGFADAFRQLQTQPALAARLADAGHAKLLAQYTLDQMVNRYQTVYEG